PGEMPMEDSTREERNFSTSVEFDKRMSLGLDPFGRNKSDGSQDILSWQREFEERRIRRGGDAMKGIFNVDAKPYSYGDDKYEDSKRVSDLPFRNLENGP